MVAVNADEALRSIYERFAERPDDCFPELAGALLTRGHATDALRVVEKGLETSPGSVEGRVERAAALLALGRPMMAFVELKRVLALHPAHRRAMRLLGKIYVDAGAPERAAALLARRHEPAVDEEAASAAKQARAKSRAAQNPPARGRSRPNPGRAPFRRQQP